MKLEIDGEVGFGLKNKYINMKKGCIYYSDFNADPKILNACQKQLRESFDGEIVSVTLNKSLNLGKNIVLKADRGVITMFRQILLGLETSTADVVFFTEHDVMYSKTHFDFTPPRDDTFYYNTSSLRWKYLGDYAVTYDNMRSLSGLCVNRKLAIKHYKKRLKLIKEKGWEDSSNPPYWARRIGFEPATKSKRQELILWDKSEVWQSKYSNIDIRHGKTLTPFKTGLNSFKHKPVGWKEMPIEDIPGWKLEKIFNL